ncbi:hypothetical protein K0M31_013806 [Melipona bicolor]|uniref:Uncharacterized protein n=1 Tax=Melipona bicolor TaxID=60889 RepID=A0AA40FHN3_9HYME|nr:hypothetical protein K0M31_013806 [Melipona bicolor]
MSALLTQLLTSLRIPFVSTIARRARGSAECFLNAAPAGNLTERKWMARVKGALVCVGYYCDGKTKAVHSDAGCSRTLPVASSWNGQDANCNSNNNASSNLVKREPLASVPCQVAEVSTSLHATTTSVKIEPVPPKSENGESPLSLVCTVWYSRLQKCSYTSIGN